MTYLHPRFAVHLDIRYQGVDVTICSKTTITHVYSFLVKAFMVMFEGFEESANCIRDKRDNWTNIFDQPLDFCIIAGGS
jgi:hypothetical protein